MLGLRGSFCLGLLLVMGGCSAVINPDDGRLGGGDDAGVRLLDSGTSRDTGVPPVERDGGGSTCASLEPRCDGDVLVTCVDGSEVRQDCQARMAYCGAGACREWVCEPDSRTCSDDLSASVICNSQGSDSALITCPVVCDPTTGRCGDLADACPTVPVVSVDSTHRIELCTKFDDETHTPVEGCSTTSRANGPDTIFRLSVPFEQTVTIELTDIDSARAVDTIVYVRRVCDDESTQVACDDDVPCSESTVPGSSLCFDGVDVRQSRITTRLAAGDYFIVVDAFLYTFGGTAFTCGTVELSIDGAG